MGLVVKVNLSLAFIMKTCGGVEVYLPLALGVDER